MLRLECGNVAETWTLTKADAFRSPRSLDLEKGVKDQLKRWSNKSLEKVGEDRSTWQRQRRWLGVW